MRGSRKAISASGATRRPGFGTTTAITSCSVSAEATGITAHSSTSGCALISCSTSIEEMFSPRRRIASLVRSTK